MSTFSLEEAAFETRQITPDKLLIQQQEHVHFLCIKPLHINSAIQSMQQIFLVWQS